MSSIRPGLARPRARSISLAAEAEYERLRKLARMTQSQFDRDNYNRQARDYIFGVHNTDRAENEIDLHGLWVNEAVDILRKRIEVETKKGRNGLHVIVGIGNHSRDGVPKIKPAVEELCRQLNLPVVQQLNPGRVYISLPQPQQKHTSSRGSSHYVSPGHGTSSVVPRVPSRVVPVQLHTPVPVRNQDHAYFQDYYHRRPPPRRVDVPLDRTPGTFILSVVAWFFFLATIPVVCLLLCPWVFWRILNVLRILTLRCLHVCLKRLEDWKVDESLSSLPYWLERLRVVLLQYNYVCSKVLGNLKVDIPQEALLSRIFWGILEYLRVHLLQFHQMCSQGLKHWKVDASSASVVYWLERLRVVILQFLYIFWRGLNG